MHPRRSPDSRDVLLARDSPTALIVSTVQVLVVHSRKGRVWGNETEQGYPGRNGTDFFFVAEAEAQGSEVNCYPITQPKQPMALRLVLRLSAISFQQHIPDWNVESRYDTCIMRPDHLLPARMISLTS